VPFKLNQDRRRHIPRQRHRVTNSLGALLRSRPAYDASLRQRGSLTVWFTDEAIAGWAAEPRTTRVGQPLSASLTSLVSRVGACDGRHRHGAGEPVHLLSLVLVTETRPRRTIRLRAERYPGRRRAGQPDYKCG